MVFIRKLMRTEHYIDQHENDVPWDVVVEAILTTKNPRKKGDVFEIENGRHYIVFVVRDGIAYVINAKRQ